MAIPLMKNHGSVASLTGDLLLGMPMSDVLVGAPFSSLITVMVMNVKAK